MNELIKAERQRYWLTFLIEDLPVGATFRPGLLHITVLPWFVSGVAEDELLKSFHSWFGRVDILSVALGPKEKFGPRKDISVNSVFAPQLLAVHQAAIEWFSDIGARWAVKTPHVGSEYKPHIRRRRGTRLKEGQTLLLNSLSLVKARRREDNAREVAGRILLK